MKKKLSELNDNELSKLAAKHSEEAFSLLLFRYRGYMMGVCYKFCDEEHEAEDVFQRGCIKAWNALPNFRVDCHFKSWVYVILRSVAFDYNRWKKRKAEISLESCFFSRRGSRENGSDTEIPKNNPTPLTPSHASSNQGKNWGKSLFEMVADNTQQPDNTLEILENNKELSKKLNSVLSTLSKEHRECLLLSADGMKYQEIAKLQKVSMGTVMSRLFYARKRAQKFCYGVKNYNQNV
jgi:RNA polymerase sigma-70 factor (ECF subfamily)